MMSCETARKLIERTLEGTIETAERAELEAHAETCPACRAELQRLVLMEEVIGDALGSQTGAEQASTQVLAKLTAEPRPQTSTVRLTWTRTAIAASAILGVGLLLGFVAGQAKLNRSPQPVPLTQVPMRIGRIEGTVLVRHEGSDVWQPLQSGAVVYLGDTFHSTPKAEFVLELENDSTIEVNSSSMLALTSYGDKTEFALEQGECTANLQSPHGPFFVRTPHGRVEALGTEFTVTVE